MDDCGSRSKQLQQMLNEHQSHLVLDNPNSEFTEVHSFGPHNFHQEHNKFKGLLNGILSRCKQCKSWNNSKQAVKAFVDRQQQIQLLQPLKGYIAECLDKLQCVIRENNLIDTTQHLELITRQVGLKFDVQSTSYSECFISSDMFYVEVQLEENGNILEVKVAHAGESVTCPALTAILRRCDYTEFLKHMQGLASLYQLACDAIQKSKIFQALITLEKDLRQIAFSNGQNSFEESVVRGPVGFVTPRQGGQLMRLTYFATPVELHGDEAPNPDDDYDFYSVSFSKFGRSLSLSVEQSKPRLLPTSSLVSDDHYNIEQGFTDDKLGTSFLGINETNSEELPASFVLHLDKPMVVSASILEKLHSTLENNKGEKFVQNSKAQMDRLIIKEWLKERTIEYHSRMAFRQKLPDEEHIYRISENDPESNLLQNNNVGVVISRIPFTHCRNVVRIIQLLRQQLVYNQLLTSVLSSQSLQEAGLKEENSLCFDVSTCSPYVIVITFEEPVTSSLASVEFQVKHDATIEARFKFSPGKAVFYDSRYVTRVVQRCLSIPVTMKYLFQKARNIQQSDGETPAMAVDNSAAEVPIRHFKTPPNPFQPQTSAVHLLASIIGGSDFPSLGAATSTSGLGLSSLSHSPTLPDLLSTPSPTPITFSSFPFVFQERQEVSRVPVTESPIPPVVKQEDTAAPPQTRLPIKIKLKKVASSDKYVIETPKGTTIKQEPVSLGASTTSDYTDMLDTAEFKSEGSVATMYQQGGSVEQFMQPAVSVGDQPMDFSTECVTFADVDNIVVPNLLDAPSSGNVPSTSAVTNVDSIFQTLPGGATGSPGGLDMDDPYGFETGLDATFDIDAEIDAASAVPSDNPAFDISNVYDPVASTSSTSSLVGNFDIDSTFDLDTILAPGSQSSDNGGMSLEWNITTEGGNDS